MTEEFHSIVETISPVEWRHLRRLYPNATKMWEQLEKLKAKEPETYERCIAALWDDDFEREPQLKQIIDDLSERIKKLGPLIDRREQIVQGVAAIPIAAGWKTSDYGAKELGVTAASAFMGNQLIELQNALEAMPNDPAKANINLSLIKLMAQHPGGVEFRPLMPRSNKMLFDQLCAAEGIVFKASGELTLAHPRAALPKVIDPEGDPRTQWEQIIQHAEAYMRIRNKMPSKPDAADVAQLQDQERWPRAERFLQALFAEAPFSDSERLGYIRELCNHPSGSKPSTISPGLQRIIEKSLKPPTGLFLGQKHMLMMAIDAIVPLATGTASMMTELKRIQPEWEQLKKDIQKEIDAAPAANAGLKKAMMPALEKIDGQVNDQVKWLENIAWWFQYNLTTITATGMEAALNYFIPVSEHSNIMMTSRMLNALEGSLKLCETGRNASRRQAALSALARSGSEDKQQPERGH